jgi:hypothetical protein
VLRLSLVPKHIIKLCLNSSASSPEILMQIVFKIRQEIVLRFDTLMSFFAFMTLRSYLHYIRGPEQDLVIKKLLNIFKKLRSIADSNCV